MIDTQMFLTKTRILYYFWVDFNVNYDEVGDTTSRNEQLIK